MGYHAEVANDKLTYRIIGIAYEVQNQLGPGLAERIYQEGMCMALRQDGLDCQEEYEIPVAFNGKVIAKRYADLMVEGEVVIELKAVQRLNDDHYEQLKTNVRAANVRRGLLLNFGPVQVDKRRYVNPNCPPLGTDEDTSDEAIADEEMADEELADEELADEELADEELADEELADEELADEELADEELADEVMS